MEKFFITYNVMVYEDCYTHGECEEINSYSGNGLITATDAVNAIKLFFKNELCFDLEVTETLQDDQINCFTNSVLCNEYSEQINENDSIYKHWVNNEAILYANNIEFNIYKLDELKNLL